jgi:hypothetical protein
VNQPQWQKDQERLRKQQDDLRRKQQDDLRRKQQDDLRRMQMGAAWMEKQKAEQKALEEAQRNAQLIDPSRGINAQLPEVKQGAGSTPNPYQVLEMEVDALRKQLANNQMTETQVRSRLDTLMIRDAKGDTWTVGFETGSWYRHDGTRWIKTGPARIKIYEQRATGGWCGFLAILGVCVGIVGFLLASMIMSGLIR